MNLAISNIAWPADCDDAVAMALVRRGVTAIEVAPTKFWADPAAASDREIDARRRWWADRGISIVAAQALLFGRPELTIFDDPAVREKTLEYLRNVVRVCAGLGAKAQVFGSPKNRRIGNRTPAEVHSVAVDFFGQLAATAAQHDSAVVLEANPPRYGADYLTRAGEAAALVRAVNHTGFRLHLDTACMTLAGDPIATTISDNISILHHFHLSEPDLAPLGTGGVDHLAFAAALRAAGYDRPVAIEMRAVEPFDIASIEAAIALARKHYFAQ